MPPMSASGNPPAHPLRAHVRHGPLIRGGTFDLPALLMVGPDANQFVFREPTD